MAHRHICKPADPEPALVKPVETAVSPVLGQRPGLPGAEPCDPSKQQRIFMKDLPVTAVKETDIQAKVVEFYNPGRFFLLAPKPEVMEALQVIATKLQNTYSFKPATLYMPCVGEVCAVQYSFDMNWYRGLVQAMTADKKMAHVLYIDFGNEEYVPLGRIRQLATNIQSFCPCVMECSVAQVVPVGGSWSAECCIAVRQLLEDRIFTVHLVETLENGRIHAVDIKLSMGELMNASLENFKRLSDGKDDNSWAQPPEPLTQVVGDSFSVVVTHLQSPSDFTVQKVENARVIQELQLKLKEHCCQVTTPQSFRPAPGTVCCAQFSRVQPVGENWSEECILALQQRLYNRILRMEIQGALPSASSEALAWCCAELPFDGQTVSLLASVVKNPQEFYCHINNQKADNIWYRAVVLEVGENELKVLYADYGNTEMVPFSRILPIPKHLLQIPFRITRCTLTGRKKNHVRKWSSFGLCTFMVINLSCSTFFLGKENFPAVGPEQVQQIFQILISKIVFATVDSFDGSANVLSLWLDTESGRRQLTAIMLDAIQDQAKASQDQAKVSQDQAKVSQDQAKVSQDQAKVSQDQTKVSQDQTKASQDQTKTHPSSFSHMPEQTGRSAEVIYHSPQPKSVSAAQMGPEEAPSSSCQSTSTAPVAWTPQLEKNTPAPSGSGR
ncbi:unnamed protein product [Tetraodon nigroviridis]|uniref:(spotted green pufferfish) hypothetical protein n=1 Tax=Tetraodon nigroviridis TaxID=99883 RepID=Q4RG73_TETNG|nr:unnamed protein product [Tetraodon nigroviridis]